MLNRRILRIKAFKVLYACAQNPDLTLKEALDSLDTSSEATRDLYLFLLGIIPALTGEAARVIEAARLKFNPTEEDLHPNLKFVQNGIAPLLEEDPDYQRLVSRKKRSWEQYDVFIHNLYNTLRSRDYYQEYMAREGSSLQEDAALWKAVYENEFEDNEELAQILEELSIYWADDVPYALGCCIRSLEAMGRSGRWDFPPLYQSEILRAQGKAAESDKAFIHTLLEAAYGNFSEYYTLIADSVSKWDRDRLYIPDIVLISMGLAEAETFPDIPLRVSINEYVEISKYYSTPKSRGFVNGLLDRLIKSRMEAGKITKSV